MTEPARTAHSDEDDAAFRKKLDTIPEVLQISDHDGKINLSKRSILNQAKIHFYFCSIEGRLITPPVVQTGVLSINMKQPQQHGEQKQQNGSGKLPLLENAVVKLETPMASSRDYKIEQVKVTMLVKDEKSNSLQEINGNWTPDHRD